MIYGTLARKEPPPTYSNIAREGRRRRRYYNIIILCKTNGYYCTCKPPFYLLRYLYIILFLLR